MHLSPVESLLPTEDFEPEYNRDRYRAQELGQEFLALTEYITGTKYGCHLILPDSKYSNLGRFVEATAFWEKFRNSSDDMSREYGPYENASEFYIVLNQDRENRDYGLPIGVMRVIKPSPAGLKSLKDLKDLPVGFTEEDVIKFHGIDPSRCADVGTLAVLAEYRGDRNALVPSVATYRTLFLRILNNPDYDHIITIIDKSAENGLDRFRFPFAPMCGREDYFSYIDSDQSRGLVAKTTDFRSELLYWAPMMLEKLQKAGASPNSLQVWAVQKMFELVDPWMNSDSELDAALALTQPEKMRDTSRQQSY